MMTLKMAARETRLAGYCQAKWIVNSDYLLTSSYTVLLQGVMAMSPLAQ